MRLYDILLQCREARKGRLKIIYPALPAYAAIKDFVVAQGLQKNRSSSRDDSTGVFLRQFCQFKLTEGAGVNA